MAVKNNLKLIFSYFKLNIKKEWQYKSSFFTQILMMVLNDFFFIIQWLIIFTLVDDIGGYTFKETMLLWAIAAGGFGVAHAFFDGAWKIRDMIYDGRLDVYLTQPKNVLINVSSSSISISAIGDIIYAFIALIFAGAPWWWYIMIIPASIISGLIFTSVHICFISFSFYMKRGDAFAYTADSIIVKTGNYPATIFSTAVKWILVTIIPALFFTFLPAQYLFITPNIWWIITMISVTSLWIFLAFWSFNKGLKHYNSGSVMGGRD